VEADIGEENGGRCADRTDPTTEASEETCRKERIEFVRIDDRHGERYKGGQGCYLDRHKQPR